MEDDHFSLDFNYHDIYCIVINKSISIVILIFLLLLSTTIQGSTQNIKGQSKPHWNLGESGSMLPQEMFEKSGCYMGHQS